MNNLDSKIINLYVYSESIMIYRLGGITLVWLGQSG